MKQAILTIALLTLLPSAATATAQIGDVLFYKGERLSIFSNPLEQYFSDENPRPKGLFMASCSACWRGYVATWKIEEGHLYLEKLVEGTCGADAKEIVLGKVFPNRTGPVKATWFTGTLRVPRGKELRYVHMGYESVYEKELFIQIEKGKVVKEETVDNSVKKKPEVKKAPPADTKKAE